MHRDTVIGIVGVVILVAAMVGVFTYERSQAGALPGGAGGEVGNFTLEAVTGTAAVGETEQQIVTFNQTGLTNVTFTLTWTPGAQTSMNTLELVVTMPDGTPFEAAPENDGEITLTVPVNNTSSAGTAGVGDWQVSVRFVSAEVTTPVGQPPAQPPVVPPNTTDQSVDFRVAIAGQAYGA
ncbi:MAG TPA: hypothetical protein VFH78_13120 [Candidatus Thermoplasmatota archaeon]|nr:hypothetical protein [Candidatus Thermoplasmatota archaeon]